MSEKKCKKSADKTTIARDYKTGKVIKDPKTGKPARAKVR